MKSWRPAVFFVSSWLLTLLAVGVARGVGILPFEHITSMVVTIAPWLAHVTSSFS